MSARAAIAEQFDGRRQQADAATLGMWTFLATEVLFFGVLFAAYVICRLRFPDAFVAGSRHTNMLFGTIETGVLLTSSGAVALAVRDLELGGRRLATALLAATALLGVVFLVMHGLEYHDEFREGLIPAVRYEVGGPLAEPMKLFFYLYYAITGLHSIHVAVGVGVLVAIAVRTWRGRFGPSYLTPVELGALYWHFVDIVWIFVYPLMYLVGRSS